MFLSYSNYKMNGRPKGPEAARIRQHKFELVCKFRLPEDLLPGSLSVGYTRCGTPTCHRAAGPGRPARSVRIHQASIAATKSNTLPHA